MKQGTQEHLLASLLGVLLATGNRVTNGVTVKKRHQSSIIQQEKIDSARKNRNRRNTIRLTNQENQKRGTYARNYESPCDGNSTQIDKL